MGYRVFLMIELARIQGIIPKDLEYDTTWERGENLIKQFAYSKFNRVDEPEYECIEAFLEDLHENILH